MKLLSLDDGQLQRNLEEAGFDDGQAEAVVLVLTDYVSYPLSTDREAALETLREGGLSGVQAQALVDACEAALGPGDEAI